MPLRSQTLAYARVCSLGFARLRSDDDDTEREPIDAQEVFDLIRHINDPEHPLTLEQLNVVQLSLIHVDDSASRVHVRFTPTIPHCSMATLIGLSIRVRLLRSLPPRIKVDIEITPGTHAQEHQINKQLNDKERVQAALENKALLNVVNQGLADVDSISSSTTAA